MMRASYLSGAQQLRLGISGYPGTRGERDTIDSMWQAIEFLSVLSPEPGQGPRPSLAGELASGALEPSPAVK